MKTALYAFAGAAVVGLGFLGYKLLGPKQPGGTVVTQLRPPALQSQASGPVAATSNTAAAVIGALPSAFNFAASVWASLSGDGDDESALP
jgi:hypothetical protein